MFGKRQKWIKLAVIILHFKQQSGNKNTNYSLVFQKHMSENLFVKKIPLSSHHFTWLLAVPKCPALNEPSMQTQFHSPTIKMLFDNF